MSKICIVTHTHLCRNPRVLKEALTLDQAGYQVIVLNAIYSQNLLFEDLKLIDSSTIKVFPVSDLSTKNLRSFTDRLLKKIGHQALSLFGIENWFALGYAPHRFLKACREQNANLYIVHQEMPVYLGSKLLSEGYRVAFDLEDWHSEDLPLEKRKGRPIELLKIGENAALTKGMFCITTSNVLAQKLAEIYRCKAPKVIYNVFNLPLNTNLDQRKYTEKLKLLWFSLHVGPGRGLEEFIAILNKISINVELHFIGSVTTEYQDLLTRQIDSKHEIFFKGMIESYKLDEVISNFDVGLAIELHTPLNREYTITNKFFQYIQNGLPVIATNTLGQQEAFEKFKPGYLLNFNNIDYIELNNWLGNKQGLNEARRQAYLASKEYNWKNQSKSLLKLVEDVVNK